MTETTTSLEALGALDPVTFEVIRHRLWAINDDQGRFGRSSVRFTRGI
jgi:hypothetical protein